MSVNAGEVWVYSLAFSPDGRLIAAGDYNGGLVLWDASEGREVGCLSAHRKCVNSLAFGPDGSLWSASWDGQVIQWNLQDRTVQHVFWLEEVSAAPAKLMPSRGVGMFQSNGLQIMDLAAGRPLRSLGTHGSDAFDIDMARDLACAATTGQFGYLSRGVPSDVWFMNGQTGACLGAGERLWHGHASMNYPECVDAIVIVGGRHVVTTGPRTMRIFDMQRGVESHRMELATGGAGGANALVPLDDDEVVLGSHTSTITVWRIENIPGSAAGD